MILSHSSSYYDQYRRKYGGGRPKGLAPSDGSNTRLLESERLLTDRAAYISFLEVQLERVSSACLTSEGFSERIEQLNAAVIALEERLLNVARALKVTKNAASLEDLGALRSSMERLDERFSDFQDRRRNDIQNALDERDKMWEKRFSDLEAALRQNGRDEPAVALTNLEETQRALQSRHEDLEKLMQQQSSLLERRYQQVATDLSRETVEKLNSISDNTGASKSLKMLEQRLESASNETKSVRKALDEALERESNLIQRQKNMEMESATKISALEERIEDFAEAYKCTRDDLKERLNRGREHHELLQELLERACSNLFDVREQMKVDGPLHAPESTIDGARSPGQTPLKSTLKQLGRLVKSMDDDSKLEECVPRVRSARKKRGGKSVTGEKKYMIVEGSSNDGGGKRGRSHKGGSLRSPYSGYPTLRTSLRSHENSEQRRHIRRIVRIKDKKKTRKSKKTKKTSKQKLAARRTALKRLFQELTALEASQQKRKTSAK